MLDHLIDPDIPTKREDLEYDLKEKVAEISILENKLMGLIDELACARLEHAELCNQFWKLEPDPDKDR